MANIGSVRLAKDSEWDAFLAACPHSTYFHSREWAELWERATGQRLRPYPRLLEFTDGTQALIPLSVRKGAGGAVKSYYTSPAGTYGGWLFQKPLSDDHADTLSRYLVRGFNRLEWRMNPLDEQALATVGGSKQRRDDDTQILDLRPGLEQVHRSWSKGHRAAVRQARREGVTVRLADPKGDWQGYFAIYQDSLERWGNRATSRHPKELFEELGRLSSDNVKLWLAETGGVLIAGALCLYSKNHVSYWHGAALESQFPRRPVHLLIYEAIRDACERGITWFDFNPSGGHEGVRAFKKSFGCQSMAAPTVRIRPLWSRVVGGMAAAAARSLGLPAPTTPQSTTSLD